MESHKDYLIELLKSRYDQEATRYKEFENSLSIPITVLTALMAGMYVVGTDESCWKISGFAYTLHVVMLLILGGLIIVTICFLSCVYWGKNRAWHTLPESKTIHEVDVPALTTYVNEIAPDNFELHMIDELKTNTIEWYIKCNTENTRINNYRGVKMFYARLFLLASIFGGLLLLVDVLYIKNGIMSKQEQKPKELVKRPDPSPITHQRNSKQDPKAKQVIEKK